MKFDNESYYYKWYNCQALVQVQVQALVPTDPQVQGIAFKVDQLSGHSQLTS